MKLSDRFDTRTAFIDMLLSGQMNLFVLFMVALALINPTVDDNNGIEHKAEFIMTVKWEDGLACDVDTWVRGPDGALVWYSQQDKTYMNLERDDTGILNDKVTINGVEIVNQINEEYWVLRSLVPGEYVVNVALFTCSAGLEDLKPIPVTLELQKINPTVKLSHRTAVTLTKIKEESHAFRFTLDSMGNMTRAWFEPTKLVKTSPTGSFGDH